MDRKYTWLGFFSLIFILTLFILRLSLQPPAAARAQANGRAQFTGTPESYLPYIAKQPTLTPTPTLTFTPSPTPTPTRTPAPTPPSQFDIFCSNGPFEEFGFFDTNNVSDTMSIETTGDILDLDVYLNVAHTFVGDLVADLTHDDTGTTVQLMDRPGLPAILPFGCPNNNISVFLDDDSNDPIEDACADPGDDDFSPGLSGVLEPDGFLDDFNGEDLSGDWTLIIQDEQDGDAGTFNDWCLLVLREG